MPETETVQQVFKLRTNAFDQLQIVRFAVPSRIKTLRATSNLNRWRVRLRFGRVLCRFWGWLNLPNQHGSPGP